MIDLKIEKHRDEGKSKRKSGKNIWKPMDSTSIQNTNFILWFFNDPFLKIEK